MQGTLTRGKCGQVSVTSKRPCDSVARPCVRVQAEANGTASRAALRHVYYCFDPANPENVVEVVAKPTGGQKSSSLSPHQSHGNQPLNNGYAVAVPPQGSQPLAKAEEGKLAVQLQVTSQQLEAARKTIAKLSQYELLYKESRMQAKQMGSEIVALQVLVADKDAELARQYTRMQSEAVERSGLRSQYTSALDEVKALRNDLEEARQAMLDLKGILPRRSSSMLRGSTASTDGDEPTSPHAHAAYPHAGTAGSNIVQLTGGSMSPSPTGDGFHYGHMQGGSSSGGVSSDMLLGLQGLAKQLAEGMEHEVGTLFGGKHHPK